MTEQGNLKSLLTITPLLIKRVLTGTIIGLAIILFFVLMTKNPLPEWGKYWMVRPLIITPLAGAAAGFCNHLLDALRAEGGTKKVLANILAILIYAVGLWLGTILGLDGTLWD